MAVVGMSIRSLLVQNVGMEMSEKSALFLAALVKPNVIIEFCDVFVVWYPQFLMLQPSKMYLPAIPSGFPTILQLYGELGSSFQSASGSWLALSSFCWRHSVRFEASQSFDSNL